MITTVAGGGPSPAFPGAGRQATSLPLGIAAVAVDPQGNLVVTSEYPLLLRISSAGIISVIAGDGRVGYSGDGGAALTASIRASQVAVDRLGNIYFSDDLDNVVRRISTSEIISTIAGNGQKGFEGDGGPATRASFNTPQGIAVDASGNLFVADSNNNRVRKITPSGTITTVAGGGGTTFGPIGDGGPAISANLINPSGVAADSAGNIYIAEHNCPAISGTDSTD
jgi:hypothetical protein